MRELKTAMPHRIGRFVVEKEIGTQGAGQGALYVAYDPELQRTIAVRTLPAQEADREALLRDAKRLAALQHPRVVAVYDVGHVGDVLYLAMQHTGGVTLGTWLEARPQAGWRDVLEVFVQAGRGLAAIVDAGIAYRGFDLSDVLLGDDGSVRMRGLGCRPAVGDRAHGDDPADAFVWTLDDVLRRQERSGATRLPRAVRRLLRPRLRDDGSGLDLEAFLDSLTALLDPTEEDRERSLLLDRVQRIWIEGVLAHALGALDPVPLWVQPRLDMLAEGMARTAQLPDHASTEDIREILEEVSDGLLVLGGAGAGKTTALLRLAQDLLAEARVDPTQPIPVVLNLSSWAPNQFALEKWIEDEVLTKYSLPRRSTRRWLARGELVLLLDGLDEVVASRRASCIEAINVLSDHAKSQIVVASRDDDYLAAGLRLRLPLALSLEPLDDVAIEGMIEELGEDAVELRDAMSRDPALVEHARTPLVLGMLAVAGAEAATDPRPFREALYERYLDAVFRRRGAESAYSKDEVVSGLSWLADAMRRNGLSELFLERMQRELLPQRWQRALAFGLGVALLFVVVIALNTVVMFPRNPVWFSFQSGISVGVLAVPVCFGLVGTTRIVPVEALTWRWSGVRRRALSTLVAGLVACGGYGLLMRTSLALSMGIPAFLILGALRGLESREEPSPVRPNQGIRQSVLTATGFGMVTTVLTGALFSFVVIPLLALVYPPETLANANLEPSPLLFASSGAAFGSIAGLTYGGIAVGLHVGLRLVMAWSTPLPLRLRPFLDHAVDRALMRRIGGGYIFVHRALLEYFADRAALTRPESERSETTPSSRIPRTDGAGRGRNGGRAPDADRPSR